jgi:hypothetical protein
MSGGSCGERMLQFLRNRSNELPQLHRGTSLNKSCPRNQCSGLIFKTWLVLSKEILSTAMLCIEAEKVTFARC